MVSDRVSWVLRCVPNIWIPCENGAECPKLRFFSPWMCHQNPSDLIQQTPVKKVMVNPSAATPWSLCLYWRMPQYHTISTIKIGCLGKHVAMWLSGSWVSSSMILTSSMELFEHILWAAQLELRLWAHPFGATRHQANSGCTDLNSTCGSKIHNRETRETSDPH